MEYTIFQVALVFIVTFVAAIDQFNFLESLYQPIVTGAVIGASYLAIGGTSVMIVVSVALETQKALEAQMMMRHYKGFLE